MDKYEEAFLKAIENTKISDLADYFDSLDNWSDESRGRLAAMAKEQVSTHPDDPEFLSVVSFLAGFGFGLKAQKFMEEE